MMAQQQLQEQQWMIAFRQGDEDAFRKLIRHYQHMVYNVCFGYVHRAFIAEELAQDVFVSLWNHRTTLKDDASLKSWLYRTSITTSLGYLRKEKRKKYWYELQSWLGFDEADMQSDDHDYTHPGVQLERKEERKAFRIAVSKLTESQQSVIVLHYVEQLQAQEIAEVLHMNKAAVEQLLFRARKQLAKHMNREVNL